MTDHVTKQDLKASLDDAIEESSTRIIEDIAGILDVMMTRIDARFTVVEDKLTHHDQQISHILVRLDSIDKRLEIQDHERLAMGAQLTRHDRWIHGVSTHTRYTLST